MESRNPSQKPWFPNNVQEIAEAAEVLLVGTDVLLEALKEHWASGKGPDILRSMLGAKGLFKLAAAQD